jgi:hypothetical protein
MAEDVVERRQRWRMKNEIRTQERASKWREI